MVFFFLVNSKSMTASKSYFVHCRYILTTFTRRCELQIFDVIIYALLIPPVQEISISCTLKFQGSILFTGINVKLKQNNGQFHF